MPLPSNMQIWSCLRQRQSQTLVSTQIQYRCHFPLRKCSASKFVSSPYDLSTSPAANLFSSTMIGTCSTSLMTRCLVLLSSPDLGLLQGLSGCGTILEVCSQTMLSSGPSPRGYVCQASRYWWDVDEPEAGCSPLHGLCPASNSSSYQYRFYQTGACRREPLLAEELVNTQFCPFSVRFSPSSRVLNPCVLCANNVLLLKSSEYFLDREFYFYRMTIAVVLGIRYLSCRKVLG